MGGCEIPAKIKPLIDGVTLQIEKCRDMGLFD